MADYLNSQTGGSPRRVLTGYDRRFASEFFAARGEDLHIDIEGPERLSTYADTIAPEAACTSVQFHLQVSPSAYADNWNAAQSMWWRCYDRRHVAAPASGGGGSWASIGDLQIAGFRLQIEPIALPNLQSPIKLLQSSQF